jgi:hypothetical protein
VEKVAANGSELELKETTISCLKLQAIRVNARLNY